MRRRRPTIPKAAPKRRRAKPTCPTEHEEQVCLVNWCRMNQGRFPELQLVAAIPNGSARHPVVAAKLKAEGVVAGVPDIMVPVARGGWFGLFIELKRREGGRLSSPQEWWRDRLQARGYRWEMCRGFEAARDVLIQYLKNPATRPCPSFLAHEIDPRLRTIGVT